MEKLTELPESDFDVITSSFAFHYIEDFPALLAMIANKLKPNGTLVFPKSIRLPLAIKKGNAGKKNEQKQQVAYRLNHYRDEGLRERNWFSTIFQNLSPHDKQRLLMI